MATHAASAAAKPTNTTNPTVDPETEAILQAAYKAKARPKQKARSLDPSRRMKSDPRDPRNKKTQWPCYGNHTPAAPQGNPHGEWITCQCCNLRLLYTPRKGSPASSTETLNAPMVQVMLNELEAALGAVRPTAKICHYAMEKVKADYVLRKAIGDLMGNHNATSMPTPPKAGYPTSPTTSMATWGVVDDEELIAAMEAGQVMAMAAMMATATTSLLIGLHLEDRDGLWEVACSPHSWLSEAANEHGLRPRRINLANGYDLYRHDTWDRLRVLRRQHRPQRLWFSLPCTKCCSWSSVNYNDPEKRERLEGYRRRERRMLKNAVDFILNAVDEDPDVEIYWEWPFPCFGWKQQHLEDLATQLHRRGQEWLDCRVDGCVYGMKTEDNTAFIKKKWMIRTNDPVFHRAFRAKVCCGNHGVHGYIEGQETARSSYYPWKLVQAWTRHWKSQMVPERHLRLLQQPDVDYANDNLKVDLEAISDLPEVEFNNGPDDDVNEIYNEMKMAQHDQIMLENMAREARLKQAFDMETCESLLQQLQAQLPVSRANKHVRWSDQLPQALALGCYSHGAFCGVTKQSLRHPELVHYVNDYLRHHLPNHGWSSVMLTFNGHALPHRDHHNKKGTVNVVHGLGSYSGGELWIQGQPPPGLPEVRRKTPGGLVQVGYVRPTWHNFVEFRPEVLHGTQKRKGSCVYISAYTTRLLEQLPPEGRQQLHSLGFPLKTIRVEPYNDASLLPALKEPTEELGTDNIRPELRARWEAQIAKFHKGAGHPSNRNLARIIKEAGHEEWKVEMAKNFHCPSCASLKSGGTSSGKVPPATTQGMYAAWHAVGVDSGEWIPPGSKTKVKFLLFMDLATKLRVVCPLFAYDFLEMRTESGSDLIKAFSERWLSLFPKPKLLVLDAAKSFSSDAVHEFASNVNVALSYVAEKEAWAHGVIEAGVKDLKMTASAIHLESLDQDPMVTLYLATSALNSTEYTAGYSAFQWAFGQEFSLTDEDVRTYALADLKDDFTRLVAAREKAEAVAKETRARRILTKLGNTTVRQPLRTYHPMDLVKIWRKVWPKEQYQGPRGGLKKSGRPHWIGPGRVVFSEVLPHQDADDDRRHIVWVLVGSQLFRCSVHSVRPTTETERFKYETDKTEDYTSWKTLADVLPKREYLDLTDQTPHEDENEAPDLPQEPDPTTMVIPRRRVVRKTKPNAPVILGHPDSTGSSERQVQTEHGTSSTSLASGPPGTQVQTEPGTSSTSLASGPPLPSLDEDVNDYSHGEAKRQKLEDWVNDLHLEAAREAQALDIYSAFMEADACMKIEFEVSAPTSNRQRKLLERHPVLYMVKKMRDSEVSLSKLSAAEKELFARAKTKEVDSFLKHEAVRKCLDDKEISKAFESRRIVRSRWVLTWKPTPQEELYDAQKDAAENPKSVFTKDGSKKAKARIVLLGFEHPSLLDPTFKTASPVQSSLGRNLLYSMAAFHQWSLEGLDLATAFLQTQATEADKEIWTTGVRELREALGVDEGGIMRILRNIYGSTTAPRGLWLDLHKTLTSLGAHAVQGERCLWIWKSSERTDHLNGREFPKVIGAMGGHVDDFHRIGDNSPEWLIVKDKVNKAYNWGMSKTGNYRHAGTDVTSKPDSQGFTQITVNQDYYIDGIPDLDVTPDRLSEQGSMTKSEVAACRTALGALQWVAIQTQPQICARCNLLLTDLVTRGTLDVGREIQEVIGEVRKEPMSLRFTRLSTAKHWSDLVIITMGDQAHANRPKGDSTGGMVTLSAGPESARGDVCPMNILAWRTWKLQRKAISSNDAEVQAMLESEDHNFRTRLLWSELHGAGGTSTGTATRVNLIAEQERQIHGIKGIICTDSRGGYDAVELNESPLLGLSNMRAALQAYQLRANLQRAAGELRWVASDFDLGDGLTKKRPDCRVGLLKLLRSGRWCIRFDPQFASARKNKKSGKSAITTIDEALAPTDQLTSFGVDATFLISEACVYRSFS
ncbi:hypothetical protein AK812_SmicGene16628 [Symbiodinium microadriaticum]|uniref:Integrase catalytic domain-containing protein n=1 Tax=Symbiodinium microadriaticum TaxID=2951 RepID=A0A1Q9DZV5_SYMMI|nr:hypothetical protein AK812_SmicGene16628 [Symbiodinium microadriaticum]